MSSALASRNRRAIIALVVLSPIAIYGFAVRPFRAAMGEAREELASQRDMLTRELGMLADAEKYPVAYRAADSALLRVSPRLFDDPDDVLAAAQLQSYVATQAMASRVFLQETSSRPARAPGDGLRALEVQFRAESDLEGVLRFLEALERGPKLVVVDQLDITKGERPAERGRPAMPVLQISGSVRGFALVEAGAGARPTLGQTEEER